MSTSSFYPNRWINSYKRFNCNSSPITNYTSNLSPSNPNIYCNFYFNAIGNTLSLVYGFTDANIDPISYFDANACTNGNPSPTNAW